MGISDPWHSESPGAQTPADYLRSAQRFRDLGAPLAACDVAASGLHACGVEAPNSSVATRNERTGLRQILALALADSGALLEANRTAAALRAEGHDDCETLGILARTHKELWRRSLTVAQGQAHLAMAFKTYHEAWRLAEQRKDRVASWYNGINAATLALLGGCHGLAQSLADCVSAVCRDQLDVVGPSSAEWYWLAATIGEADLLRGRVDAARSWYERACRAARGRYAFQASTRRQARLLLEHLELDVTLLDPCFGIPPVIALLHGESERVPEPTSTDAGRFNELIDRSLRTSTAVIGYTQLTCDADLMFCEMVLSKGGDINVVLPQSPQNHRSALCRRFADGDMSKRMNAILQRASRIHAAGCADWGETPMGRRYLDEYVAGLAQLRARQLQSEVRVESWSAAQSLACGRAAPPDDGNQRLMAMMFADAVDYSKLPEQAVLEFMSKFLGTVARLIEGAAHKPLFQNTWGDAVHVVFDAAPEAAEFALALRDACGPASFASIPAKSLNLRISLHFGPVHSYWDPVIGRTNVAGAHVNRAARIEPITPPGGVYGSEAFAAILARAGRRDFVCEYVGLIPLAKNGGIHPMYHIRRAHD